MAFFQRPEAFGTREEAEASFDPRKARGTYTQLTQERLALDTQLYLGS